MLANLICPGYRGSFQDKLASIPTCAPPAFSNYDIIITSHYTTVIDFAVPRLSVHASDASTYCSTIFYTHQNPFTSLHDRNGSSCVIYSHWVVINNVTNTRLAKGVLFALADIHGPDLKSLDFSSYHAHVVLNHRS